MAAALIEVVFLLQAGNAPTKELLRRLTHSGKIYLIPVNIRNKHIIRFVVTSQFTTAEDILRDWTVISETAAALLAEAAAPNNAHPPESGKNGVLGDQGKQVSVSRCDKGDGAGLKKETERRHDNALKQCRTHCSSEPPTCTCSETKSANGCEEKPRLNGTAAVPTAKPQPGVVNADLAAGENSL